MRGIILDIRDNRAVVIKKNGAIATIKNKNYKIGQEIGGFSLVLKPAAIYAASLILIGTVGQAVYAAPTDYIYIDINPSIRLGLNCFSRVVERTPLNGDAEELLKNTDIKSSDLSENIDLIVEACRQQNYINESNKAVELEVCSSKSNIEDRVAAATQRLESEELTVTVDRVDKAENKRVVKLNVSPKRLKAIEGYTAAFGGTVEENTQKLRNISVKEINSQIESCRSEKTISPTQSAEQMTEQTTEQMTKVEIGTQAHTSPHSEAKKESDTQQVTQSEPTSRRSEKQTAPKRLEAIRRYTNAFGGTVEENTELLSGKSVKQINALVEEKTGERVHSEKRTERSTK